MDFRQIITLPDSPFTSSDILDVVLLRIANSIDDCQSLVFFTNEMFDWLKSCADEGIALYHINPRFAPSAGVIFSPDYRVACLQKVFRDYRISEVRTLEKNVDELLPHLLAHHMKEYNITYMNGFYINDDQNINTRLTAFLEFCTTTKLQLFKKITK